MWLMSKAALLKLKAITERNLPRAQAELVDALKVGTMRQISECREHVKKYQKTLAAIDAEFERRSAENV